MKLIYILFISIISIMPVFIMAQDVKENKAAPSLERIADDVKFRNGEQFMSLKKYNRAIEELQEYLEIYYDGNHRHEAYNMLAGIYFDRFDYARAIRLYRGLYEEFSNREEGVAAYYHVGLCYVKMGYDSSALDIFQQILNDYPGSEYALQAKMQLDLLKILNE